MAKEKFYFQDRKGSHFYFLKSIVIEPNMTIYEFYNPEGQYSKMVNNHAHIAFVTYLIKEGIAIGTRMLLNIDESGTVQFAEIIDERTHG